MYFYNIRQPENLNHQSKIANSSWRFDKFIKYVQRWNVHSCIKERVSRVERKEMDKHDDEANFLFVQGIVNTDFVSDFVSSLPFSAILRKYFIYGQFVEN